MPRSMKKAKKTARRKRTWNVGVAVIQARALQLVTKDLLDSLNRMQSGDGQILKLLGYSVSAVLLRAFATELMLKTLSYIRTKDYRSDGKGHDLLILFNDLDDETKKQISGLEKTHGIAPMAQILEKHRNDFVDWRYLEDVDGMRTTFPDLEKALGILMMVFESLQQPGGKSDRQPNPRPPDANSP